MLSLKRSTSDGRGGQDNQVTPSTSDTHTQKKQGSFGCFFFFIALTCVKAGTGAFTGAVPISYDTSIQFLPHDKNLSSIKNDIEMFILGMH